MKKIMALLAAVCLMMSGCSANAPATKGPGSIKVVATIFPGYDWATALMDGSGCTPELLMKNGVDMHSFQPSTADIVNLSDADLFIYVGGESDAWVENALQNARNEDMIALSMMDILADAVRHDEHIEGMESDHAYDHDHEEEAYDEHVWLSLRNAQSICAAISDALCQADQDHAAIYESNLAAYTDALDKLDKQYQQAAANAAQKTVLFGDRFPFLYLMNDYELDYYAAFPGCSAETEASFATISFLAGKVDELSLPAVLTIDGSDQKIAKTIIENTGAKSAEILTLDSMQSVTDQQIADGVNYLSIMEDNLSVLQKALS